MAFQLSQKVVGLAVLGLVVVVAATALTTLGLLSSSRSVQSHGAIKAVNVGVYWDSGCTNASVSIGWGLLSPGASGNVTLFVRNEGNLPVRLSLSTQGWSPANASSYMSLGWNRDGYVLAVGNVTSATLTLSVSSGISGITDFSFTTVITGTEQ